MEVQSLSGNMDKYCAWAATVGMMALLTVGRVG